MGNEIVKARLCATVTGGRGYGISHCWDGTVLTVSSDSGSSSADLVGPQGPAGDFGSMTEEEKVKFSEDMLAYMDASKLFVAELRLEDGEYTADKSFEEIKEQIDAGNIVVCDFVGADSRTRCHMTTCTDYSVSFVMQSVLDADEYFTFTAEGVTHMTADVYQDFIEYINNHIKDGDVFTDEFYDTILDYIDENEPNPAVITTTKEDDTVNVRVAYGNNTTEEFVITLNDSGYPDTVTYDNGGRACLLRWEGFD